MATQNIKFAGESAVNALATEINKRLIKVSSMPGSPSLNMTVLYIGATSGSYVQGSIYQWDGTQWNLLNEGGAISTNYYKIDDSAETGIDDADYFPFYDTSATSKKKTLWSNIKSVLKTYFDTIYLKLTDKDEYTATVTQTNGTVTFTNLNPSYGYSLEYNSPDAEAGELTVPKWSNMNKTITTTTVGSESVTTMTIVYTMVGGVNDVSQYALRIKK